MKIVNYECKARVNDLELLEEQLLNLNPRFIGRDHQIDTYFDIPLKRLKIREGTIENSLIYYSREDIKGAKQSDVILFEHNYDPALKQILSKLYLIKAVVNKIRKIYFIENVKFHFDNVLHLGTFVEIEAIDSDGSYGIEKLKSQCNYYIDYLKLTGESFISESYCDLILLSNLKHLANENSYKK